VRALAVTGMKRWKGMPDLPTMDEQGLKGFNVINWFGLWLPAGAAPELVARLNAETVKALKDPELAAEFDKLGLEPVGSAPDDFARFVVRDSVFTQGIAHRLETAEPAAGRPATKE
jgi:tripartite-type tricarboxylate transporter receptor subunit TctC